MLSAPEKELTPSLPATQAWARNRGPELLRFMRQRDLDRHELGQLKAIQAICPCRYTDNPERYEANGETCEICGRPIGIVTATPAHASPCCS